MKILVSGTRNGVKNVVIKTMIDFVSTYDNDGSGTLH